MFKAAAAKPERNRVPGSGPTDLQTQFETLLDEVWRREAEWRLYDRIDAFCAAEPDHCGVEAPQERRPPQRSKR
jgi:hypothetical protein